MVCSSIINDQHATIPVASKLPSASTAGNKDNSLLSSQLIIIDIPMMGSIIDSLTNLNQNQTALVNGCSTGNCTFPMTNGITHSTIGMCSQCIDITSRLQGNDTSHATLAGPSIEYDTLPYVDIALPNGLLLQSGWGDGRGGVLNASCWDDGRFDSILSEVEDDSFVAIIPASIINWTMIAISGSDMPNIFLSTACSLYPCMRHYAGLVDRGEFKETLVSTVPALLALSTVPESSMPTADNFSDYYFSDFYAGITASCVIDGKAYDLTRIQPNQIGISENGSVVLTLGGGNLTLPSQCINKMDSGYVGELAGFLTDVLVGSCSTNISPPCSNQWWLRGRLWNSGNATLDTVQTTFDSVVESITKRMQVQWYDPSTDGPELIYGNVIQTTTCIAFSWEWMLFPALLIILTVICLVVTMVQPIYGVEKPLWKSSILPLLYASPGTQLIASGEAHDMKAKSKITVAKLEKSKDKWSFVGISSERV